MTPRLPALALLVGALALAIPTARLTAEVDAAPARPAGPPAQKPVRVASLSSEADEMLMDLVGPARLACITYLATSPDYSSIAESAVLVPRTIRHIADIEPIVSMEPDLVVVNDFNRYEVVQLMREAGLAVHRIRYPQTLEVIAENLVYLGRAVGEEARAAALLEELRAARAEAEARAAGRPPVRVLFLSGHFFAEGTESLPGDLIRICGGRNVIEGGSRQVSPEEVVFLDPDLIVMGSSLRAVFAGDPALMRLRARLETARWRDVQPPSQYAAGALRRWAKLIHPVEVRP